MELLGNIWRRVTTIKIETKLEDKGPSPLPTISNLSSSNYLSDPTSLNILDLSQISWVTSLFLKLLPCIPCLWKASTESVKQTEKEI